MCCGHFSKFQCNLLHGQHDSCKENRYSEPPISDHPKCEDLMVADGSGGGYLRESNHNGLRYDMVVPYCHTRFLEYSEQHSE